MPNSSEVDGILKSDILMHLAAESQVQYLNICLSDNTQYYGNLTYHIPSFHTYTKYVKTQ